MRERFGDGRFAGAGMAGEKEYVAGMVFMNGHGTIVHSTGLIVNRLLPILLVHLPTYVRIAVNVVA